MGQISYRIIARVDHVGRTMTSGHYTAEINVGEWKHCDDKKIVEAGRWLENSKEVYLVFCEKQ